jgi:hypothetical protein
MKKSQRIRPSVVVALAMAILFPIISCDREPVDERPELPPVESLVMDFSDFAEPAEGKAAKGTLNTYMNFTYSYLTVGFWNVAATLYSVLPVTAYTYALQQSPVYLGDHTWEWAFDFPLNNLSYTATLTGKRISNEEFSMEMVIGLTAAPNTGVKWFDGVVRYDHTHAIWTLYENGTMEALEIEWNMNYETGNADLTYEIVKEGNQEFGSYITWAYDPEDVYDASFTISVVAGMTNIEWDAVTIQGRVKAPVHFGDELWHCWDSKANGLADIVCP